jgi:hypothetical protein
MLGTSSAVAPAPRLFLGEPCLALVSHGENQNHLIRESITITYAGTPLTGGYPVSREIVLQSLLQPVGP